MNRRKLKVIGAFAVFTVIALLLMSTLSGPIGSNDSGQPTDGTATEATQGQAVTPSGAVLEAKPSAKRLHKSVSAHFDDVRVLLSQDGAEVVVEYSTDAESASELETELHQIAQLYADSVENESAARTLVVSVDNVQAVAPKPTVAAYVNGSINKEAYLETVEIIDGSGD